jgi:hypothetical protein
MHSFSGKRKKMLACMVAAGLAVNLAGGMAPASAQEAKEAGNGVETGSKQSVEAEIIDLTQRLNDLESQLKTVKKSETATKEQLKKNNKKENVKWSGATKSGYWADSTGYAKLKSEFKLYGDADIGDGYHVNMGLKFKSTTSEPSWVEKAGAGKKSSSYKYSSEKNKIKLEAANVSKEFNKNLMLRVGTMKAEIGEGLWLSKGAVNAVLAEYSVTPRDWVQICYGRDSQDYLVNDIAQNTDPASQTRLLKFIDYKHSFSKDAFAGIYYGSQQPEKYIGVYGEAPLTGKFWVAGEYVRNMNNDKPAMNGYSYGYDYTGAKAGTKAYVLDLNYGKAKKAGTWGATLEWLEADQNIFMDSSYTSFDDYIDSYGYKGFATILSYATSNNSKLQLLRYWGSNNPVSNNLKSGKAMASQNLSSVYVKFTTKF